MKYTTCTKYTTCYLNDWDGQRDEDPYHHPDGVVPVRGCPVEDAHPHVHAVQRTRHPQHAGHQQVQGNIGSQGTQR